MILSRRSILTGLLAAPIVVRAGLLMPVRAVLVPPVDLRPPADFRRLWQDAMNKAMNPPLVGDSNGIDWAASRKMADFMAKRLQTPEVQWLRLAAERAA